MDLLGDGLQLITFLWVSIIVLSVIVTIAFVLALFLNVTGRRIFIIKERPVGLERRLQ
jgi:hypothetical protein